MKLQFINTVLRRFSFCVIYLFAFQVKAWEPEPFRQDEIEGRDFDYRDDSFLSRYAYRLPLEWEREWHENPQGFRITAGSVRSKELYVLGHLRKQIELNEDFFGEIQFFREEDFDSRYDRFLTGVGYRLTDAWSLFVTSDIFAEKEEVDIFLETRWHGRGNNWLRIAFVSVDLFFNEKNNDESHYQTRPYTFFLSANIEGPAESEISGFINWNPTLKLELGEDQSIYNYEQVSGALRLSLPASENWLFTTSVEGEVSLRERASALDSFAATQDFERHNIVASAEVIRELSEKISIYSGLRYFMLSEDDQRPNDPLNNSKLRRREHMVFAGVNWQIDNNWTFRPGSILDYINNSEKFLDEQSLNESAKELLARFLLPVEYRFSEFGKATVNTTLKAPDGPFGGLNVQFLVRF